MWIVVNRSDSYKTLPNGVVLSPGEVGRLTDVQVDGLPRTERERFERLVEQEKLSAQYVPDNVEEQPLAIAPAPAETTVDATRKRGRSRRPAIPPAVR